MIKKSVVLFLFLFTAIASSQEAKLNEIAPNFKLVDSNSKEHSLSDYSGKLVLLEWINYECPFVKKHYDSRNMQTLQEKYTNEGVSMVDNLLISRNQTG